MEIGERIKQIRTGLKMTQVELAKLSGVRQSTISAIEVGKNTPTTPTLEVIAKALKCSVAQLLNETIERQMPGEEETTGVTVDELQLLQIYRQLTDQGKFYVFQSAMMAQATMKKSPEGEGSLLSASGD